MAEAFVSLATILRGERLPGTPPPAASGDDVAASAPPERVRASATPSATGPLAAILEELARVRVAALEALERRAAVTLERLADEVLARELAIAPPALATLVARALESFRDEQPIAIVIGPHAMARIESDVPVRIDPALGPGDVVVEVRHGAFESTLAFRLSEAVFAANALDVRA